MVQSNLNNQETIFLNGEKYFASLFQDIDAAKNTIELETYIFQNDELGMRISDTLINATKRGVNVKILVDGAGTPNWGDTLTKKLESAGIETRIYHPFPWRLWQWNRAIVRVPFIFKLVYFLFKINKRNHRKVCIIDRQIIYIGSANISKCHLSENNGGSGWRDTAVRLTHANINDLIVAFEAAWTHSSIQERIHKIFQPINPNPIIRLNNTRHRRRVLYKALLFRMANCKTRVWITNAYFVPDNFLLRKLIDLAETGLDVRIVLPQKSDVFIMPWASSSFYARLLKSGVRIFEYMPSMLHAKTLILDDWFIVGSSNLNHRSLLHDLEVDVNIRSDDSKKAIEQQFLEDLVRSKEIHLDTWYKRTTFWQKVIGRLLLYMKYWI